MNKLLSEKKNLPFKTTYSFLTLFSKAIYSNDRKQIIYNRKVDEKLIISQRSFGLASLRIKTLTFVNYYVSGRNKICTCTPDPLGVKYGWRLSDCEHRRFKIRLHRTTSPVLYLNHSIFVLIF